MCCSKKLCFPFRNGGQKNAKVGHSINALVECEGLKAFTMKHHGYVVFTDKENKYQSHFGLGEIAVSWEDLLK